MVFSSLIFLCIFLPVVFLLYCVIKNSIARNALLIIASLVFYAFGEPVFVLILIASSIINYAGARWISSSKNKKPILALIVIINIGVLCVFKYTAFVLTTINQVSGASIHIPTIGNVIGISFFTFQALSYVIDVYAGRIDVQKNYFKVLLYISFFPQLIAGPIVKYRDISREIDNRQFSAPEAMAGLRRFIIGLGKKVLIANTMAVVADYIFDLSNGQINSALAWIAALAYLMQIYYDFSGYSDMAIGLGRMFGFHFKENFLYPYGSTSIQEFWRRWHISLSSWFKEYLYIPLGGNRKGKGRTNLNKIIVFFFTGLWHGANWTFVIWGLFHGAFLLLENSVPKLKKMPRALGHIYTFVVVCVGFVIFRADNIGQACYFIKEMFSGFWFTPATNSLAVSQLTPWVIVIFIAAVIGMAPIRPLVERARSAKDGAAVKVLGSIFCIAILVWCIIRLSSGTYNPFIYFRF